MSKQAPVFLITGKNGQVGWELQRTLMPLGQVIALGREELDLSSPDNIRSVVQSVWPDVIVNAAAYTAVDRAEQESELAMQINGIAPGILASEAKKIGALMLHYSTDYVFDGSSGKPYLESDKPNPINKYGRTKLAGEQAIQSTNADYLILRTTWVYTSRGNNFLKTVLRLAQEREQLSIVDDQKGAPTWARFIAESTAHIIRQSLKEKYTGEFESQLYHLTAGGVTSWFNFAEAVIKLAGDSVLKEKLNIKSVRPIPTKDYPLPAKRPMSSVLSTEKLQKKYMLNIPDWEMALTLCFDDLVNT